MSLIFVAYRRGDTKWITGRIFDRLQDRFGKSSTFIDIETIPPGQDFRTHIDAVLQRCRVLVAVVGPQWTGAQTGKQPRIFDTDDWVRLEIETAFKKNIHVIPVRVDQAPMPKPEDLPESIRPFAYLQVTDLDSGRDFNVHMQRLIRAIERHVGWTISIKRYKWVAAFVAAVVLLALLYGPQLLKTGELKSDGAGAAIRACSIQLTLRCAQEGGVFGSSDALAGLKSCKTAQISLADEPSLQWKDIWTTSVYSYVGDGGPGGGKDDDVLKVGGWGDWYFSLIQFNLPRLQSRPLFAAIALYSKETEGASVPLALDRIIQPWDFPKGGTLWWKDRPGHRAVTTDPLPAPKREQWYVIELTALVQEWLDGKSANYGFQIRPTHEFGSFVFFVSSDAADKSKIPRLIFCM